MDIDCIFILKFLILSPFLSLIKVVLTTMIEICKIGNIGNIILGLQKIKVTWNKVYDVIISISDVTNKIYDVTQIIL